MYNTTKRHIIWLDKIIDNKEPPYQQITKLTSLSQIIPIIQIKKLASSEQIIKTTTKEGSQEKKILRVNTSNKQIAKSKGAHNKKIKNE